MPEYGDPTGGKLESIRKAYGSTIAPRLQSFPSRPQPHSMLMTFADYSYKPLGDYNILSPLRDAAGGRFSGVTLKNSDSIELPFPTQLVDNTSLNVGNFERDLFAENIANKMAPFLNNANQNTLKQTLNNLGSSASKGLDGLMSAASGGMSGFASGVSSAVNAALDTQTSDVISGAAYMLRSYAPSLFGGTVGGTIDNVTGQTINPRQTLAFSGVDLKTHNFTWELYPSNETDSNIIRNIVNTLKVKSLPAVQSLGPINRAFLKYPSVVYPYLIGVNTDHWLKFKPCMIQNVTVDYGGAGIVSIIKGGKPAAVTLNITMMELEIHTEEEYIGGVDAASAGFTGSSLESQNNLTDTEGPF